MLATLALALAASPIAQGPDTLILAERDAWNNVPDCPEATDAGVPCRLVTPPPRADRMARLRDGNFAAWAIGDTLHALWRAPSDSVESATLSGGLQMGMSRISGTRDWALSLRLPGVDRAVIDMRIFYNAGGTFARDSSVELVWRGSDAPSAPPRTETLAGRAVVDTIWSRALGEERRIAWYLPPHRDPDTPLPVVYMGDAGNVLGWAKLLEPRILDGSIPPVALVGAYPPPRKPGPMRGIQDDLRAVEYLEGVAGSAGDDSASVEARYRNHMRFFVEELSRWAEATLGVSSARSDRAIAGVSNSGYFALTLGARHRDRFGAVIAMSHNRNELPGDASARNMPMYWLTAGSVERRIAPELERMGASLDALGIRNRVVIFPSGHDSAVWAEMFPEAVGWWLGG